MRRKQLLEGAADVARAGGGPGLEQDARRRNQDRFVLAQAAGALGLRRGGGAVAERQVGLGRGHQFQRQAAGIFFSSSAAMPTARMSRARWLRPKYISRSASPMFASDAPSGPSAPSR